MLPTTGKMDMSLGIVGDLGCKVHVGVKTIMLLPLSIPNNISATNSHCERRDEDEMLHELYYHVIQFYQLHLNKKITKKLKLRYRINKNLNGKKMVVKA